MEEVYYAGKCPICCGLMELIYEFSSGRCSVMCDECSVEFSSPDDLLNAENGHRTFYRELKEPIVRSASLEEIKASGWYPYITHTYPRPGTDR